MRVDELISRVRQTPFEPFEICLSDGSNYAVHHPDQLLITPRTVHVGIRDGSPAPIVQQIVICDLAHVTCLVPLRKTTQRRRRPVH